MECRYCGKPVDLKYSDSLNQKLRDSETCYSCDYWLEWSRHTHNSAVARIDGRHYRIGREDAPIPPEARGFGGSKFTIRFFDGRVVETTNLWTQGEIPIRFRGRLPDNAEFVRD